METKHETTTVTTSDSLTLGMFDTALLKMLLDKTGKEDTAPLSEEPTNERIDRIEDVKPGDLLSIGKGLFTVSGIVKKITGGSFDAKVFDVFFEETILGYCVGGDEYEMRSCYRPLGHTDEDGPQAAGDDEPESKQSEMLRITDVRELRQGDRVHLHKGEVKVEGLYDAMRSGETIDECGVEIVFTDETGFGKAYEVLNGSDRNSYVFDYAERRPYDSWTQDDLPKEPGFYRGATGSVWKYDGKLYAPVLGSDGKLAPAASAPTVGAGTFLKRSLAAHRFPFVRVSVNVGMYRAGADE